MRSKIFALCSIFLAACGGGEPSINCQVENSCIFNTNVNISAPSPAASSPTTSPSTPFSLVKRKFPVTTSVGDLTFVAGGVTYFVGVVTNGDAEWVFVYSAPAVGDSIQMTTVEAQLDAGLDTHRPGADDASLHAYLAQYVIPRLDTWIKANAGRWSNGMASGTVSTTAPAATLAPLDRLAARLAQWVKITPTGAALD